MCVIKIRLLDYNDFTFIEDWKVQYKNNEKTLTLNLTLALTLTQNPTLPVLYYQNLCLRGDSITRCSYSSGTVFKTLSRGKQVRWEAIQFPSGLSLYLYM